MERLHYSGNGSELRAKHCYGGLDLSVTTDLTSLSLVWPLEGIYVCAEWYWMPGDKVREFTRKHGKPYDVWVKAGWIKAIPGPVVDHRVVRDDILALREIFDIGEIRFDPAFADTISLQLIDDGFTMVKFGQNSGWMNEPTRELLNLILQRRMAYEPNPVSTFNADCLSIKQDENDKVRPVKPERHKTNKRIDGMVSRIMALDGALRNSDKTSVYEDRGILFL